LAPSGERFRVVHIDDEEDQLFFAKTFLEEADPGLEIVPVKTVDQLFQELERGVDCVVSDFVMPEVDGVELCRRVKERFDVPFLVYTGRGSEVVAERAFRLGVDDYIRKESDPSHYQLLARRIRSHVEASRARWEREAYQRRLEGLRGSMDPLVGADTLEAVSQTSLNILSQVLGYHCCSITIKRGEGLHLEAHMGEPPAPPQVPHWFQETLQGGRWLISLPLGRMGEAGAITVAQDKPFGEYDKQILKSFSLLVTQAITRVQQVETITTSEKRFRGIVENVQDAIVLTSPGGEILYASPAVSQLGFTPGELVGKNWGDLVHPEDQGVLEEFYRASVEGKQGRAPEYRLRGKEQTHWVSHTWAPVVMDGVVKQMVSAVSDITWRKRAERALMESLEKLEAANRDLNDFTHIVSHDLKAPLMTIESFSEFLLEDYYDRLDETGREYLESIVKATTNMRKLIDDLLTLSRIGRVDTAESQVDVGELLEEVKGELQAQIEMKNAVVTGRNLPTMWTQGTWMKQLLLNLVSNGLKFNENQPPRVEVSCHETREGYVFRVSDNGIGIPEDQLQHLFKLFHRLDNARGYPGTGAGLSICKKIVESLGGDIWAESRLGYGTTFTFTLPRLGPSPGETPPAANPTGAGMATPNIEP